MVSPHFPTSRWSSWAVLVGFAFIARGVFAQSPTFVIHGVEHDCQSVFDLDRAFRTHNEAYFANWSDQDYDTAVAWVTACSAYKTLVWDYKMRITFLRTHQHDVRDAEREKARQDAILKIQAQEAAARKQEAARYAVEREKQQEAQERRYRSQVKAARIMAGCHSSDSYKLYRTQESILLDRASKDGAERALARERKIAQISGTENVVVMHNAGSIILTAEEDMAEDFAMYKKLGGTAQSPQTVTRQLRDPCAH